MLPDEEYRIYGDPRVLSYPLMASPVPTCVFIAIYFTCVKLIGPKLMKNRKPYQLKMPIYVYNMAMVLVNGWIVWNLASLGWLKNYNWRCEPIDVSDNKDALQIVFVCWVYFFSKLVEFADTVFFVLRKKDKQLSKLHVFHHCNVPFMIWNSVKYGPGGYNTLFFMANAFVHVFMYLYYGLAVLGPAVQKYLWWKKYLTSLQLLQFMIIISYALSLYLFPPDNCKVSTFLLKLALFEGGVFLVLFTNFYLNTYQKKNEKVRESN